MNKGDEFDKRDWLQGDVFENLAAYWKEQLAGLENIDLPTDYPRPPEQTFAGRTYRAKIDAQLSQKVKRLAQSASVTLNTLLLSVFNVLLYRYTQHEDIAIGIPIANRNQTETKNLIGFFLNTLVIRTDLTGEPTFRELLEKTKSTLLDAYEHQDMPFEKLIEVLNPVRDMSRSPLVQIMFVMEDTSLGVERIANIELETLQVETRTSKFDLTLFVEYAEDNLYLSFEYSTDIFSEDRIKRMAMHYEQLLKSIVDFPDGEIASLELLTEAEKHQVLVEWNDTVADYPKDKCIHH